MELAVSTHDHLGIFLNGGMISSAPENVKYFTLLYNAYPWKNIFFEQHVLSKHRNAPQATHLVSTNLTWAAYACTVK